MPKDSDLMLSFRGSRGIYELVALTLGIYPLDFAGGHFSVQKRLKQRDCRRANRRQIGQ